VQALTRLLAILDIVAAKGPASAAEIAQCMDLPFSTVARLTRQLAAEGLLNREDGNGRYVIGWRIFDLASSAQGPADLGVVAIGPMTRLRNQTGETVSLHVRRGDQRVCICSVQSEAELRRVVEPGSVQALVGTTGGEVLLAGGSDDGVDALVHELGLSRAEVKRLRERIDGIREDGYAVATNERLGVAAVSVPVSRSGRVLGALSVSGPLSRFTVDEGVRFAPDVLATAEEIAKLAGS
jgi:DNA-binding IclR family transcriptional regulator